MANPTNSNAAAGDFARTTGIEVISRKSDATGMAKGDVVHFDTAGLAVKATSTGTQADGFGVALEAVAANADGRFAIGNTWIYVLAGAAIVPYQLLKVDATAGRVAAHDKPADANSIFANAELDAARDYFGLTVGRYIGHQLEEVGDPTDAADGDVIAIRLGL